jgi:flagellar M-ring protein FliF
VVRTDSSEEFGSAQAIRHLVAAAVPGLTVDQVTVLSTSGVLLASGDDATSAASGKLVGLENTISREIQDNVSKTLAPYLGLDNFQVSVTARLNTDKKQINETIFDPESKAERSVRVVKESGTTQNTQGKAAVSVEQNLPQGSQTAQGADQSTEESSRREEVTNFEMNSKTISTVSDGYSIENLSIAVVVNRDRIAELLGQDAKPDAFEAQAKEIEALVASAAGLDEERGDRLKVTTVQFFQSGAPMEAYPSEGFMDQIMRQSGSYINALALVVITVLVIWFGMRPAMKSILQQARLPAPAQPGLLPGAAGEPGQLESAAPREPSLIEDVTSKMRRTPQKRLEQMVAYDDVQAAHILKQWITQANQA